MECIGVAFVKSSAVVSFKIKFVGVKILKTLNVTFPDRMIDFRHRVTVRLPGVEVTADISIFYVGRPYSEANPSVLAKMRTEILICFCVCSLMEQIKRYVVFRFCHSSSLLLTLI